MTSVSIRRAGTGVAALVLLLGLGACSKSEPAAESTTTTAKPAESTTTEGTTKKSSAMDKLAKGEADETTRAKAEKLSSSFESSGMDLDDDEVECLAEYLAGSPELADIGDSPTAAQAEAVMDVIASCIPKEKFVQIVMQEMDDGTFTQDQLDCIEDQLMTLSSDDMAAMMSGTASSDLEELFAPCENP